MAISRPKPTTFQVGDKLDFWGLYRDGDQYATMAPEGKGVKRKPTPFIVHQITFEGKLVLLRDVQREYPERDYKHPGVAYEVPLSDALKMVDECILQMRRGE